MTCALRDESPMVKAQLFFGRDIEGRAPVSDAEWDAFATDVLSKNFPDGFTVMDAQGAWRDQVSQKTISEPSKVVIVATPGSRNFEQRLDAVAQAYKEKFQQQSVGLVTYPVCAKF